MIGWHARVEAASMEWLAEQIDSNQVELIAENDQYYLVSPRFSNASVADVLQNAEQLVNEINAAVFLDTGRRPRLKIHSMMKIDESGVQHHLVSAQVSIPLAITGHAVRLSTANGSGVPIALDETLNQSSLDVILNNPQIREVVGLFERKSDDWTQLCNILTMVRNVIGGEIPENWGSKSAIELLEHTAQGRETAGDTARHPRPRGNRPPSQPMKLETAQQVVRTVLRELVRRVGKTP